MKKLSIAVLSIIAVLFSGCREDPLPKPKAYLRLEYPNAEYEHTNTDLPFSFERNKQAKDVKSKLVPGATLSYGVDVVYPELKGTIYLTYRKVNQDKELLINYLRDAQNFTQKHTIKADEIAEQVYINKERKVYGMFYEVGGDAASQSQFYVTDSLNHFLTGSLYFYAKPNYDSILPAANYLMKDIRKIMETVEWK